MFEFAGVSYYDGQGFLIPTELGITSATQVNTAIKPYWGKYWSNIISYLMKFNYRIAFL